MHTSLRLFRTAGIDVRVHVSWLLVFGLVTWSLATSYFPQMSPGWTVETYWLLGAISALLLFGAVLLHELSHSLIARRRGLEVHSITLFVFGGVSTIVGEPQRPATEFFIAIVGPVTSLVLAGLSFLLSLVAGSVSPQLQSVLEYLAIVNALLGVFNLVPGFPLDGGRVLRSVAWQVTGNLIQATRIASGVGQVVAYGFIFWGIWQMFGGNVIGGLWIAVIGWFLSNAAEGSMLQVAMDQRLAGVKVRDVMRREPVTIRQSESVEELVERYMLGFNLRAVPVVDFNARLVGMVTLSDVRETPRSAWPTTPVERVMSRTDALVSVRPDDSLTEALHRMGERDLDRLPVVEDGELVGMLSRSDVIRQLQLRALLTPVSGETRALRA